jgi:hypothetical protein
MSDNDCSMLFRSFSSCDRALAAASLSKSFNESPFVQVDPEQYIQVSHSVHWGGSNNFQIEQCPY